MTDPIEKEIREFLARKRASEGLGKRPKPGYPSEQDFYLYLTDKLDGRGLDEMLDHLTKNPDDQAFTASLRTAFGRIPEAEGQNVPEELLQSVRRRLPRRDSVPCPHCRKPLTPFKKPLGRQKLLNAFWIGAGLAFFILSFAERGHFIQWSVLGALCLLKWIVDSKATKTQVLIYKALSETDGEKTRHLHRTESHL